MIINMTLYSHNLIEPHKSFETSLKLSDFKSFLQRDLQEAKKVMYMNPKGEVFVLKGPDGGN